MGSTTLKSKPANRSQDSDKSLSPVSPLDSTGESWKYPPNANTNTHPKTQETLHKKPLEQAPARTRLSRPFDQPYPMEPSRRHQPSPPPIDVPTHANMKRADSHLRRQPAQMPRKKPAPRLSITIPAPAHQARRQQERIPGQRDQVPAERSDRRQRNETRVQRSARHRGLNPLEELARQQGTARNDRRRSRDLERQDECAGVAKGSKHDDPQYYAGRRCFFFLVVMMVIVVVVIVIVVKRNEQQA